MKIVRSGDCGNSPKNRLVEDLAVALATGDVGAAAKLVTDDVEWRIPGATSVRGRAEMTAALGRVDRRSLAVLRISRVLSHGRAGAVNGTVEGKHGVIEFCDLFEFASTKGTCVARITSYRIAC